MAEAIVADVDGKTIGNAKRQFVELYGSALALNAYFKLLVLLLLIANVGLAGAVYWVVERYRNVQPLVVRVDEDGRAEAAQFTLRGYVPDATVIRYFLVQFTEWHFRRSHSRTAVEHAQSLRFLAPHVEQQTCSDVTVPDGAKDVEAFIGNPTVDETEVRVIRAVIRHPGPLYEAEVRFQCMTGRQGPSRTYTAQVSFSRLERIPEHIATVNPLGFQIQRLHVDSSFSEEEP